MEQQQDLSAAKQWSQLQQLLSPHWDHSQTNNQIVQESHQEFVAGFLIREGTWLSVNYDSTVSTKQLSKVKQINKD